MFFTSNNRLGGRFAIMSAGVAAVMLLGLHATSANPKEEEKAKVKKMMQAAHKGEKDKRDAPLEIVQDEVAKDAPNWEVLVANTRPLAELAAAIKDNETYTSMPGPYVDAVKALSAANEKKSLEEARASVANLMKSCAGCHRE